MGHSPFFVPVECQVQAVFQNEQDVIVVSAGDECSDAAFYCLEGFLQASDEVEVLA